MVAKVCDGHMSIPATCVQCTTVVNQKKNKKIRTHTHLQVDLLKVKWLWNAQLKQQNAITLKWVQRSHFRRGETMSTFFLHCRYVRLRLENKRNPKQIPIILSLHARCHHINFCQQMFTTQSNRTVFHRILMNHKASEKWKRKSTERPSDRPKIAPFVAFVIDGSFPFCCTMAMGVMERKKCLVLVYLPVNSLCRMHTTYGASIRSTVRIDFWCFGVWWKNIATYRYHSVLTNIVFSFFSLSLSVFSANDKRLTAPEHRCVSFFFLWGFGVVCNVHKHVCNNSIFNRTKQHHKLDILSQHTCA